MFNDLDQGQRDGTRFERHGRRATMTRLCSNSTALSPGHRAPNLGRPWRRMAGTYYSEGYMVNHGEYQNRLRIHDDEAFEISLLRQVRRIVILLCSQYARILSYAVSRHFGI
jgi:hypothetical protein